jgi:hypothetical protein
MADQTLRTTDQTGSDSPHGFEKAATKSVTDQALSAGRDLKDKACHVTQNVRAALRSREIRWLSQGNGGSSISDSGERRGNRTDDPCGILLIIDIDEQSTQLHGEVKQGNMHRVVGAGHMVQQSATADLMAAIDEAAAETPH